jgi:hypothetical protein
MKVTNKFIFAATILAAASCKKDSKKEGGSVASSTPTEETNNNASDTDDGDDNSSGSSSGDSNNSGNQNYTPALANAVTADDYAVTAPVGSLALAPVSFTPAGQSARLTLNASEMDEAEQIFSYDDAKKPIENSEKFRCISGLTDYSTTFENLLNAAIQSNAQNALTYNFETYFIKQLKQGDIKKRCLSSGNNMNFGGGQPDQSESKIVDVTIYAQQQAGKRLLVRMWFGMDYGLASGMEGGAMSTGGNSGSAKKDEKANFYVEIKVAEPTSVENLAGVSVLTYEVRKSTDGNEESEPFIRGRRVAMLAPDANGSVLPQISFRESRDIVMMWSSTNGYRSSYTESAIVRYERKSEGAEHGYEFDGTLALTRSEYSWSPIPSSSTSSNSSSFSPGTYAYYWNATKDMAAQKWIPAEVASTTGDGAAGGSTGGTNLRLGGGDGGGMSMAEEMTICRDNGNPEFNIYNYGIFTPSGERIHHATYYPIETGKTDAWGNKIWAGIGPWGAYVYGVDHGETVQIVNPSSGAKTNATYVALQGQLVDSSWKQVVSGSNIVLKCSSQCPLADIQNGNSWSDSPNYGEFVFYVYKTDRKLYRKGSGATYDSGAAETEVVLADLVDQAWVNASLSALDDSANYTWQMNRSRYTSVNMTKGEGEWVDYWSMTYNPDNYTYSDIHFTCQGAGQCPKANLSSMTMTSGNAGSDAYHNDGASRGYYYRMTASDWADNYQIYSYGVDNQYGGGDDQKVSIPTSVRRGKFAFPMVVNMPGKTANGETWNVSMVKEEYGGSAALRLADNSYFRTPDPLKFEAFTYQSSQHAYVKNPSTGARISHSSADGLATDDSQMSWNGLSFDGWFCCISWAATGVKDQYNNDVWGPKFTLAKGLNLVVTNPDENSQTLALKASGGLTTATVKVAPLLTERRAPIVDNSQCGETMISKVESLNTELSLPAETDLPYAEVKASIGSKPTTDANNQPIQAR